MGTLGGEDVLCVIDRNSLPHVASIIEASSLDDALDAIAQLAGEGKISLALDFCNLVKKQFAGDEDVEAFSMRLEEEKKKSLGVDFYEGFPDSPRNTLKPIGRIYEINRENGIIVDVLSHKRLFFFREQLLGQLKDSKAKDLIGQPVLYSIKKGGKPGDFQARSIIKPLTFSSAYDLAEDLYYHLWQPISACDILRLITNQADDPDYDADLRSWSKNSQVRNGLWNNEKLPKYDGPEETLRLTVPETISPVILQRQGSHMVVETGLTGVPEVPIIMSKSELATLTASVRDAALAERVVPMESFGSVSEDDIMEDVSSPLLPDMPDLPSLDDCPDGDRCLKANATVTIRFRSGSLFVEGEEQPFTFRPEDVIDPDLRSRAEMISTDYVKGEKVVSQLSYSDRKATNICLPKTVLEMLALAEDAIQEAYETDSSQDKEHMLDLYMSAEGFVDNVLDLVPANPIALTLKDIASKGISKYGDKCYKAPFNALKPCGIIKSVSKKKQRAEVEDPHFVRPLIIPYENIIDTEYTKPRKGDEVVYSVFRQRGSFPIANYVCLARPASELIKLAEGMEEQREYEKAWGIAMNILDSEPNHSYAISLSKRCQPFVAKEIVAERQKVLREDLFAQAQIAAIDGKPMEAINLYERILGSQDDNPVRKRPCVYRLLGLFSELYHRNPTDGPLKNAYRKAGEKYLKGMHTTPFVLPMESKDDLDCSIQFYEDMGEMAELVKAYKAKKPLLTVTKGEKLEDDERREQVAQVNANIAWYSLIMNDNSNATEKCASWAMSEGNDLGRICHAVVLMRRGDGEKTIKKKFPFSHQAIDSPDENWVNDGASRVFGETKEMKSLVYERYSLLCRIIQGENVVRDAARYLATLTCSESEYIDYVDNLVGVPDDCNLVQQLFRCLQRGSSWSYWTDVRLLCMLSEDAAYKICSIMYDLDPSISAQVLIKDGLKILHDFPQKPYFSGFFAEWRGGTIYNKYASVFRSVKTLTKTKNSFDLDEGLEFFRDLDHERWMVHDDHEAVNDLRYLPEKLTSFFTAKDARTIMSTSREIKRNIDNWTDNIRRHPTLLSKTAFFPLLVHIRDVVTNKEADYNFDLPKPNAKVLSASSLGVEHSMFLVVEITNANTNADAMRDCELKLKRTEVIRPVALDPVVTYSDSEKVYGGESLLYILHFRLNQESDLTNLSVQLQFSYRVRTTQETTIFNVPFTIADQFEDIQNDYNFGGQDNKRFYGREHFIKNVSNVLSDIDRSPHFFIYGQKRSGKSSVLYQIKERIRKQLPSAIPVDINFLEIEVLKEEDIYYNILSQIFGAVEILNWEAEDSDEKDVLRESVIDLPAPELLTFDLFVRRLTRLQSEMKRTRGWENSKLILFVDEFTKAHQWLKDGIIKKEFMWRWKGLQARGLFGAVLIGQDVLHEFIKETDGPNAFAVLEKERLNYLEPEAARSLVIEPIFEATGRKDIYLGHAVDKIIYYSASSAHYTKWICYNLVNYMNTRRLTHITEADVDAAIWNALKNASEDDIETLFDPLYFSDITSEKESQFTRQQTISVLDAVADVEREDLRGCKKAKLLARTGQPEALIDDLNARGVLDVDHEFYTLKVKLYNVWRRIKTSTNRF